MHPSTFKKKKPRAFIGSSVDGKAIAELIQLHLHCDVDSTVWCQGVFGVSSLVIEDLTQVWQEYDFACLVLTADDLTRQLSRSRPAPREKVIFELGLFMGSLGRDRTLIVHPTDTPIDLPGDLGGVTTASYDLGADGNLMAALGPVCTTLKRHMQNVLGLPETVEIAAAREFEWARPARRRRLRPVGSASTSRPKKSHPIADISVSGLLLATDRAIPVGTMLDLTLDLENGSKVAAMANVVRVQQPGWGVVAGVGAEFVGLDEHVRGVIDRYVREGWRSLLEQD